MFNLFIVLSSYGLLYTLFLTPSRHPFPRDLYYLQDLYYHIRVRLDGSLSVLVCTVSNRSFCVFVFGCQVTTLSYVLRKVLQVVYHLQEAVYHQTYERGLVALCTCIVHLVILLLYTAQTTKARRSHVIVISTLYPIPGPLQRN